MHNYKPWLVFNKLVILLFLSIGIVISSFAAINVDRTRIVFAANDINQSLTLANDSAIPMLVQVWSDIGDIHSSPDTNRTPLIILPPIFKMAPGELRSLRLVLSSRDNLPTDRESVFWLNLYQIPPENLATQDVSRKLILPLRLRLKVFIRPAGLKVPTEKDEQRLHFSATSHGVMITNPTPWYMSLVIMTSIDKRRQHNIMLAPYEKTILIYHNPLLTELR